MDNTELQSGELSLSNQDGRELYPSVANTCPNGNSS